MMFYFEIFFKPLIQKSALKISAERKMLTLASSLDAILCGDFHRAADILIGRFKSLEEATTSGSWELAAELEVLPRQQQGLTSEAERQRAANIQIRRVKLQSALATLQRHALGISGVGGEELATLPHPFRALPPSQCDSHFLWTSWISRGEIRPRLLVLVGPQPPGR